jgi:hypothetical protein
MPCYGPYDDISKEELEEKQNAALYELNLTTRFACECLTNLEKENSPIPEYIKDWWEKHKKWDKRRKEIEQTQQDAINEERKKFQQIIDAVENGVETLFPPELLKQ